MAYPGYGLLPPSRGAGEALGFFRRAEQRLGLVDAFLLLGLRIGIRHDAGAGLHVHGAVLDQRGAQDDAAVELAGRGKIADRPGVEPALVVLELVDDLHRPHLGRARDGAGREACGKRVERVMLGVEVALDVGDDVHHLAEALDEELVGHLDRGDARDAAHIVAAEIEQHQVLGTFLGIGQQGHLKRLVFLRGAAARPRAGDRPDGDGALAHPDQDLRARSRYGETAEIEEVEKGRRIDPAERTVERKGRQLERRLEALRQHDLEDVAGGDVLLGRMDHALVFCRRGVRRWPHRERPRFQARRSMGERRIECVDDGGEALARARIGHVGGDTRVRPHRRDDRDGVLDRVEHHHDGGAHQHRVGNADRIGIGRRQFLHQPHHVVAEIAENACGHRRQELGKIDAALGDQAAQGLQRRLGAWHEAIAGRACAAVDLGLAVDGAPDEVRLEPDDRVASAHRAAFDRFQQKALRPALGDLQERRYRCLEVGNEGGPDDLRLAPRVALGERRCLRLDLHGNISLHRHRRLRR